MEATESGRVAVVTGASRGFGRAIALELARRGHRVVATMRRPADGRSLAEASPSIEVARLDVTDPESVRSALRETEERHGRIDVLVNNAGYGLYGAVEDLDEERIRRQLDTNFLGVWRTCKAVLPGMRRRGSGLIVNVSSGAARLPLPLMGLYCASKAAMYQLSAVLAYEVRRFGVAVVTVEPGAYRTDWQTASLDVAHGDEASPYAEPVRRALAGFREAALEMPGPESMASAVADVIESPRPCFHNFIGPPGGEEFLEHALSLSAEERDAELRGSNPFFPDV